MQHTAQHLYRAVSIIAANGAGEILRYALHDVLV